MLWNVIQIMAVAVKFAQILKAVLSAPVILGMNLSWKLAITLVMLDAHV